MGEFLNALKVKSVLHVDRNRGHLDAAHMSAPVCNSNICYAQTLFLSEIYIYKSGKMTYLELDLTMSFMDKI